MKVAILDGANLLHRSRYGMGTGEFAIVYNFYRCLRPLVEIVGAEKIYMTLEGRPTQQLDLLPAYKSNRATEDPEKLKDLEKFRQQRDIILDIFRNHIPIHLAHHPNFEGDDVIGAIAHCIHPDDDVTVVSTDTDFIQLLQTHKSCRLYNPVSKKDRAAPEYDYILWKALRGDKGDGIPGVPGVGDKKAENLVMSPALLKEFISSNDEFQSIMVRNMDLIRLTDMSQHIDDIQISVGDRDWGTVRKRFWDMGFGSMANPISWNKYISTFRNIT